LAGTSDGVIGISPEKRGIVTKPQMVREQGMVTYSEMVTDQEILSGGSR
jgi:hypothetical protein